MKYGIMITTELMSGEDKELAGKIVQKYFNRFLEKAGRGENIYINFFTESKKVDEAEEETK